MVPMPIPKMLGKKETSDCLVKVSQMQNLRRTNSSTSIYYTPLSLALYHFFTFVVNKWEVDFG